MNRKFVKLASIAIVSAGISSTALAESNLPAALDEDINRRSDSEEMAVCHDANDAVSARLGLEAPWVSLALVNAERIGLSDEQIRQLELLRTEFERTAASQSRSIATGERGLQQLLVAQPVDLRRVSAQLDEIATLRSTLRLRRIETLLAGRDLLSTDQRERLQASARLEPGPLERIDLRQG